MSLFNLIFLTLLLCRVLSVWRAIQALAYYMSLVNVTQVCNRINERSPTADIRGKVLQNRSLAQPGGARRAEEQRTIRIRNVPRKFARIVHQKNTVETVLKIHKSPPSSPIMPHLLSRIQRRPKARRGIRRRRDSPKRSLEYCTRRPSQPM